MSLYAFSVPTYQQILGGMLGVMDKAMAQAETKKFDKDFICNDRLYPDMFNFARQVQSFTDHAARSSLLCAGKEANLAPRDETSLEGLKVRIEKALEAVNSVKAAEVDANADTDVTFPMGPRQVTMKAKDYMMHFAFPNFYFHATTAYDILRARGIEIGKRDFLGAIPGFPKS